MSVTRSEKIQLTLGSVMTVVGTLATVAPRRFAQTPDLDGAARANLTRMWALREAALGAILLSTARSAARKPILATLTGLAAAEAVANLATPALGAPQRAAAVGSSVLSSLATGYAWRSVRDDS